MPWVVACVGYGTRPLRVGSLFPTASGSPAFKLCWPSEPDILGAHFSGAELLVWGVLAPWGEALLLWLPLRLWVAHLEL